MSVFKKIYKKLLLCFSVFLFISSAQAATFTKTPLKAGFIKIKQGNKYLTINQGGATNAHKITLETLKNDSTQIFAVISYGNIRAILGTLNNDYSYDINTGLKKTSNQGLLSVYGFYYAYSHSLAAHRIIETYRIGDESNTTYLITNPTEAANDNFYGITNYQWCRDTENQIKYLPKEYNDAHFEIEYVSAPANAIPVTSNSGAVKFTDGDIVSIKSLLNNLFVSCKKQGEPGYQPWTVSNTSPKAVAYDSRLNPESLFKVRKAGNDIGFEPYELDSNNDPLGTTRGYLCFNKDITFNVGNSIGNWKEYYKLNIQNVSGNTYIFNVKGYINRLDFFVGIVPDDVALRVGYSNKKDTNGNYTRNMLWEIKKLTPERVTELTTYAIESYAPKVEIEEVQLAAGDLRIKDKNDNYITIKKAGENDYSFGLAMEASLSSANLLFGIRDGNNFKIFGTLNTDRDFYSDMPNIKYTKTVTETGEILGDLVNMHIKQGFLSSYRNGSFQTSWYNSFYGVAIKIYKVVGTQNANTKYLITNATGYAYNSFFGVDTADDFTFESCQNDPNAQFEIEGTGVPSDVTTENNPTEIAGFVTIQKDNKFVTITNNQGIGISPSTGNQFTNSNTYKISLNDTQGNPGILRLIDHDGKQKILGSLNNNYFYDINNTANLTNQGFFSSQGGFNKANPQEWNTDTVKFYKITNAPENTYLINNHMYLNNVSTYGISFYKIDNTGAIGITSNKNEASQFVINTINMPAGAVITPLILEPTEEDEEEINTQFNNGQLVSIKSVGKNKYLAFNPTGPKASTHIDYQFPAAQALDYPLQIRDVFKVIKGSDDYISFVPYKYENTINSNNVAPIGTGITQLYFNPDTSSTGNYRKFITTNLENSIFTLKIKHFQSNTNEYIGINDANTLLRVTSDAAADNLPASIKFEITTVTASEIQKLETAAPADDPSEYTFIKIKKDGKCVTITSDVPDGNRYGLAMQDENTATANNPQILRVLKKDNLQAILGTLNNNYIYNYNGDPSFSGNLDNQGLLWNDYPYGSQTVFIPPNFVRSWPYSWGTTKQIKIFKTSDGKYLITTAYLLSQEKYFGIDDNGIFTKTFDANDPRAKFDIEIIQGSEIDLITDTETEPEKTAEELEREQISGQIVTLKQLLLQKQTALTPLTGFAKIIAQAEIAGINAQISALQQILSPPAPPPATTLPARTQRRTVSPFGETRRSTTGQIRRPTRPTYGRPTYSRVIQRRPTSR